MVQHGSLEGRPSIQLRPTRRGFAVSDCSLDRKCFLPSKAAGCNSTEVSHKKTPPQELLQRMSERERPALAILLAEL